MAQQKDPTTCSTPSHGDAAPGGIPAPAVAPGFMPTSMADLGKRLAAAGTPGAAPVAAIEPPRPGLSELTLRVLDRWGALPLKAVACVTGWSVGVGEEDAQLLGECTVDVVRHSAVAPDPRTEAWVRLGGAYACALGEGFLARFEKQLEEKRKKTVQPNG